jgi:hypothetical protein
MSLKPFVAVPKTDREWQKWALDSGDTLFIVGSGDPNGVHTASRPRLFMRTDGGVGTSVYYKSTDGVATGWVALP